MNPFVLERRPQPAGRLGAAWRPEDKMAGLFYKIMAGYGTRGVNGMYAR